MDKREYKELSELAANGGTKAFARLYETVYREMYYTAFYTLCDDADRSEERRVGKECRSRWSPDH